MPMTLSTKGNTLAILSFVYWGIAPIYWQIFTTTSPFILAFHRFIWSAAILLVVVILTRRFIPLMQLIGSRTILLLFIQAVMLMLNWVTFAYAFSVRQTIQAGLGYALNPLVNVAVAMIVFKERLSKLDYVALALAILSFCYLLFIARVIPTITLILGCSFAVYGALKKRSPHPALLTLSAEMLIASVVSSVFLIVHVLRPLDFFAGASAPLILLISSGLVTIIPLLLYTRAVQLIPFVRAAFFQFLVPVLITTISLTVLRENIPLKQLPGYGLMWLALMVYVFALFQKQKQLSKSRQETTKL